MRRRPRRVDPADEEPPARLKAYDPANWLPLVDVDEYHPDDWRNIRDGQPYGEPRFALENWHTDQAWHLWAKARHDWCDEHGWPGGSDIIDLMRQRGRAGPCSRRALRACWCCSTPAVVTDRCVCATRWDGSRGPCP